LFWSFPRAFRHTYLSQRKHPHARDIPQNQRVVHTLVLRTCEQRKEKIGMEKPSSQAAQAAHVFANPSLLPAQTRLLLDPENHTALLVSLEGAALSPLFRSFPLTPSATQVFLSLLQAYPHACSHQALFRALYPEACSPDEQAWDQEKDLAIPLIRRALKSLLPTLRGCGLQAVALRGQGYVLAKLSQTQEQRSRS